jgi:hypothetical protein
LPDFVLNSTVVGFFTVFTAIKRTISFLAMRVCYHPFLTSENVAGGAPSVSGQGMGAAQSRPIDGEVISVRVIEVGDPRGGRDASRFVSELDSLSF